jgi:ATP-binding cassette subfamily F protein uup
VLEGGGVVGEYVGGYTDWVRQRKQPATPAPASQPKRATTQQPAAAKATKKRRLSVKETSELATLPDRIDALDRERETIYASLGDPAVLRDGSAVVAAKARLAALELEITELIQRWETLELIATEE